MRDGTSVVSLVCAIQSLVASASPHIGLRVRRVELSVWAKNLTDRRYLAYGSVFGGNFVLLGEPRTWGVTLSTRTP